MSSISEDDILSKVEVILPHSVVETCYLLPTGVGTEFLSTNISKATMTRTLVSKGADESVRIHITVSVLQVTDSHQPEHVMIKDIKRKIEGTTDFIYENGLTLNATENLGKAASTTDSQSLQVYANSNIFQDILPEMSPQIPNPVIDPTNAQIFTEQILESMSAVESLPSEHTDALAPGLIESQLVDQGRITESEQFLVENIPSTTVSEAAIQEELGKFNNTQHSFVETNSEVTEVASNYENINNVIRNEISNEENGCLDESYEQTSENYMQTETSYRIYFEKCLLCSEDVSDLEALRDHLLSCHADEARAKGYISMVSTKLKVHCEVCREELHSQRLLNRHMEEMHLQGQEIECDKCGVVLDNKTKLEQHNEKFHQEKERFLCHLCPSSFKVHSYLLAHLRNIHTSTKENFNCDKCNKNFATEKYLYNHNLRVHGEKKYSCTYCEKGFTNAANRDRHITLVHERTKIKGHACPLCERFFALKFNMIDHIKTVHKQEFSHSCELCGAGFRRQSEVVTHIKAIHGDSKVRLPTPIKRKPGRPNRSGLKSSLGTKADIRNLRHNASVMKQIFPKTSKSPKMQNFRTIEAVLISAPPEVIKTIGIVP